MINIKRANKISWVLAFIVVNNVLSITPSFGAPYFAMIIITSAIAILNASFRRIDFGMLCLYICCILSIVGNDIPSFFRPWQRFIAFVLVTQLITPFLKSEYLWYIRLKVFTCVQRLFEFVAIGSIIAYFLGQGMGRGGFVGITEQAMLIAPLSANTIITSIYSLHSGELGYKGRVYQLFVLCCAFLCILLAASRTAVVSTLAAAFIYLWFSNKGEIGKFTKYIMGTLVAMFLLYPLWAPYLENIENKNKGSIEAGGMTSSRDAHWKKRIEEWKESPIIGIGFVSVSTNVTKKEGATFDPITGTIEPGTSWLAALSMTGVLGFVSLVWIFIHAFWRAYRHSVYNKKYAAYIAALIVFWSFHMVAEGYIFSGGSYMFFNVWLVIGVADALYNYEHVVRAITPDDEEEYIDEEEYEDTEEKDEEYVYEQ